jgi:hypothetical protein
MKITFQNRDEELGPENAGFTFTIENQYRSKTIGMVQRFRSTDGFLEDYGDCKFEDRSHAPIRELLSPEYSSPLISYFEVRGKMYLCLGAAMEALRAAVDEAKSDMARDTEESATGMF